MTPEADAEIALLKRAGPADMLGDKKGLAALLANDASVKNLTEEGLALREQQISRGGINGAVVDLA